MAMRFDAGEIITAMVTPMDKDRPIAFCGMAPAVTSSTCLLSTWTAGSAATIK